MRLRFALLQLVTEIVIYRVRDDSLPRAGKSRRHRAHRALSIRSRSLAR